MSLTVAQAILLSVIGVMGIVVSYFGLGHVLPANMAGNVVLLGFATALRGTRMTRIGEPCRFSIKEGQEIVLPEPAQEPSQVTFHHIALMLGLDESVRLPRIYDVLDGNIAIRQRPIDLAVVIDIECADLQ